MNPAQWLKRGRFANAYFSYAPSKTTQNHFYRSSGWDLSRQEPRSPSAALKTVFEAPATTTTTNVLILKSTHKSWHGE